MVDDVVAIPRETIRGKVNDGFTASELNLVVVSHDVLTAFDQVDHEQEAKLLEDRGVDLGTVCALMKENVGVMVQLRVSDVGLTKPVPMQKRQCAR